MNELDFALRVAERAGVSLKEGFRSERPVKRGSSKDVKSVFDMVADEIIVSSLEEEFPNHSYITEETGLVEKGSDFIWIIDPLDGTGNFENSNPFFSVSIALYRGDQPVLGVIEAPMLKERFWAVAGEGAYSFDLLRGERKEVSPSKISKLEESYFVYCEGGGDSNRVLDNVDRAKRVTEETRKVGSAALELAWVAMGRADGYFTTQIKMWDIAAGLILAQEAGVRLLNFDGKPYSWSDFSDKKGSYDLLATNDDLDLQGASFLC